MALPKKTYTEMKLEMKTSSGQIKSSMESLRNRVDHEKGGTPGPEDKEEE